VSEQLRKHPHDLDALVTQAAAARGLPAPYVEKDFWVAEVLRAAAVVRVGMPDGSTEPVTFRIASPRMSTCWRSSPRVRRPMPVTRS